MKLAVPRIEAEGGGETLMDYEAALSRPWIQKRKCQWNGRVYESDGVLPGDSNWTKMVADYCSL